MNAIDFRLNGATGVSDMAGEAARVAIEDAGAAEIQMTRMSHNYCSLPRHSDFRMNGAIGVSDMARKAAQVAVERCGKQPRYNEERRGRSLRSRGERQANRG